MEDKHDAHIENGVETPENASQQATEHSGEQSMAIVKVPDLYDQMAKTWQLPIDDLILLVNPPPKVPVTIGMAQRVLAASKQYGIPIPGFNLIPVPSMGTYTLYINAAGMQFRLATDPRGLESIVPTIEHMADLDKEKDYISIKATIKMKDGSVAEDFGVSEWPAGGKDGQMRLGDLVMKLTTKAIRRASTRLVGTTLPVYDEDWFAYIAGPGKEVIEGEYIVTTPKPKPEKPTSLVQLLTMALDIDKELTGPKLVEIMGITSIEELRDLVDKTWEKIKNDYGTREA